jgi:hypothetical protein
VSAHETVTGALREARAALLNPDLTQGEREQVVRVVEGAITVALTSPNPLREALVLAEEALSIHAIEDQLRDKRAGREHVPDDGDALVLQKAREALGKS